MKKTRKLACEIVVSCLVLIDKNCSLPKVLKILRVEDSEIYQFIEDTKERVISIKLAFLIGDWAVAWDLVGGLLKQLQVIGGQSKKDAEEIARSAAEFRANILPHLRHEDRKLEVTLRKEAILKLAREVKITLEEKETKK